MDQPAYIVEAIKLCENLSAKVESERLKESQKDFEREQKRQTKNDQR
jgi:hypothetical protein